MSETWKKILQFQVEERRRLEIEKGRFELKKREKEEAELRKKELSQLKERERNANRTAEIKRTREAEEIAISLLEDIRMHSDEIRQARFSEVIDDHHNISLRWGNKFEITEEEDRLLQFRWAYDWTQEWKRPRKIPKSFVGVDYSEIGIYMHETDAPSIIVSPEILMRKFAIQLIKPKRHLITYVKGVDYLRAFTPLKSF